MRIPGTRIEISRSGERAYAEADEEIVTNADLEVMPSASPPQTHDEGMRRFDFDPGTTTQILSGVIGADGETYESYGALFTGGPDINPELSGRRKYWVYNEMRRTDPAVKSLLWMFKLPIRQARWSVLPASDDPFDQLVADAVRWQFGIEGEDGRLDLSWDASLSQALLMLDWGAMFEEKVWGDVDIWTDADGTEHMIRPLNRLMPLAPSTIIALHSDKATGKLDWVEQDIPGARPVPGSKVSWYVLEKEGRNWWGTSMLRPCYGSWRLKKDLMIAAGIGWDRFSAGVPVVRYPESGGTDAQRRAERIGQNYRVHERAWIAMPASDEWQFEIAGGGGSLPDPVNLLRHYDGQIAMAGLQMFAKLGTTETGSRAVGEVLGEPFYNAAQAIANDVAIQRQRHVLKEWVTVNFGEQVETPKIQVSKLMTKNLQILAAAIANLASAGMSFTDRDVQNDLRDQLELSELPEEVAATLDGMPDEVGISSVATDAAPGPAPAREGAGLNL